MGEVGYEPGLLTVGLEGKRGDLRLFGRYEKIFEDSETDVEENFYAVGISYIPTKNYTISLEIANFNSGDLTDASDLRVADDSTEGSVLVGIRAKF